MTEWLLPGLACPCCGAVTFAGPPPGTHAGSVSYGPVLNAAAVLLACCGNVPPERAAQVMGMPFGVPVLAGWADKAAARVAARLGRAGFDEAMTAALAAEDVLAADETPVNVLDKTAPAPEDGKEDSDPEEKEGKAAAGAPHMLITRTPDGRLTFLQAIGSRRKAAIAAGLPAGFTGYLITDGYAGYQHLLGSRLAGIQQCAAHVIRRCRAVIGLGPGGLQSWAGDIITILREAHQAVEAARARGDTALDQQVLNDLLNATTSPSPPGSSATGCGTGAPEITPDTRSGPGCGATGNRSSCSPRICQPNACLARPSGMAMRRSAAPYSARLIALVLPSSAR